MVLADIGEWIGANKLIKRVMYVGIVHLAYEGESGGAVSRIK